MYWLGQDDLGTSSEEKFPFANSPSTEDDDLDGDKSKSDSNEDIGNDEPLVQSVIGLDGFKEFIMLLLWTINDFNSSIKEVTSTPLGRNTKYPSTFQCVFPLNEKNATTRV